MGSSEKDGSENTKIYTLNGNEQKVIRKMGDVGASVERSWVYCRSGYIEEYELSLRYR